MQDCIAQVTTSEVSPGINRTLVGSGNETSAGELYLDSKRGISVKKFSTSPQGVSET